MQKIIRYISSFLFNTTLILSFILTPISSDLRNSQAYADDTAFTTTGCVETNDNDVDPTDIYQVGCEFNKNLAKTDLDSANAEGIAGYVEQFIAAVFALIGITLFFTPIPESLIECPSHIGTKVTFPIVQAGCLSYLIGEVAANNAFEKASKIAVDKAFAAKQDESSKDKSVAKDARAANDAQVEAYNALIEIYGKQVQGLDKKITLGTLAELAFITAGVFEATDISTNMAAGESLKGGVLAAAKANSTLLYTNALGVSSGSAKLCSPVLVAVSAYLAAIESYDVEANATAAAFAAQLAAETAADKLTSSNVLTPVGAIASMGTTIAGIGKAAVNMSNAIAKGSANDAQALAFKTLRSGTLIPAITTSIVECQAAIAAASVTTLGTFTTAIPALESMMTLIGETIVANEAKRLVPITCTGTDTIKGADADTPSPIVSSLYAKMDYNPLPAMAAQANPDIKSKENLFYIRKILNNFFHRMAYEKLKKVKSNGVVHKVSQFATNTEFANFLTNEAMERLIKYDFSKEENKINERVKDSVFNSSLISQIESMKLDLIQTANAGTFKELLNLGVKVGLLYFTIGKTLKNLAFPKPINRIVTWGIMAMVNAAVIVFDRSKRSEAKKRQQIVREERDRFLQSHAVSSGLTDLNSMSSSNSSSSSSGSSYGNTSDTITGDSSVTCAVSKAGGGYAPATCSKSLSTIDTGIDDSEVSKIANSGGVLAQSISGIKTAATTAAKEGASTDGTTAAKVAAVNANKSNLVKARDAIIGELDKQTAKVSAETKSSSSPSIASTMAKFKKLYSGSSSGTPISSASLSEAAAEVTGEKEEEKDESVAAVNVPDYKLPSYSGSSNKGASINFGSGKGGVKVVGKKTATKQESLSNFKVNTGEINENQDVSIFKLLSNRYLMKFPVLLEEVKK